MKQKITQSHLGSTVPLAQPLPLLLLPTPLLVSSTGVCAARRIRRIYAFSLRRLRYPPRVVCTSKALKAPHHLACLFLKDSLPRSSWGHMTMRTRMPRGGPCPLPLPTPPTHDEQNGPADIFRRLFPRLRALQATKSKAPCPTTHPSCKPPGDHGGPRTCPPPHHNTHTHTTHTTRNAIRRRARESRKRKAPGATRRRCPGTQWPRWPT